MINSNLNNSGLGKLVSGLPVHNKESPILAEKKTALRDVQNDNRSFVHNKAEGSNADVVNLSGAKRFSPECNNTISPRLKLLKSSFMNSHPGNVSNRFNLEPVKAKIQESAGFDSNFRTRKYFSTIPELPQQQIQNTARNTQTPMASQIISSPGGLSVPISQRKCNDNTPASVSTHLVKQEVPRSVDFEGNTEEKRKERFFSLQKFLKYCDESDQRGFIQGLLKLSPAELSSYAFALEKRSIQLSFEEASEIQRKQALNILGKSSVTNTAR